METVAKLDPVTPRDTSQTAYGVPAPPTATNPVAGPTTSDVGLQGTEGVSKLTVAINTDGLYLVVANFTLITASNAATSHFVRPLVSYTINTGNSGIAGIGIVGSRVGGDDFVATRIADADGVTEPTAMGLDAKTADAGTCAAFAVPIVCSAGTNLIVGWNHTITGACTDGGTYRVGIAVIRV